jgi:DNA-binding LytR/AlgR family response regulator
MKTRYIILDDEPLARKLIVSHASRINELEFAGECADAVGASLLLRHKHVDLIFLDIQMPEMDGFQFLRTLNAAPAVILTTAYRSYAPEAFEFDVVDYLLKPVSFERFLKATNRFFERSYSTTQGRMDQIKAEFVYVKADRKLHKVVVDDILYIESLDEYIKVHTGGQVLVSRETITAMEEKLRLKRFVRIHRSFLVSARHITAVSAEGVELRGKFFPFGRAYKQNALASLSLGD